MNLFVNLIETGDGHAGSLPVLSLRASGIVAVAFQWTIFLFVYPHKRQFLWFLLVLHPLNQLVRPHVALFSAKHIFQGYDSFLHFVFSNKGDKGDAFLVRIGHLFFHLCRFRIDFRIDAVGTQLL